ncbi:MAG: threonylcarbamoyl-AMP synthase [bacterium]|nr:threonylcarbamoyl-AMP synthase [bacterium]
MNHILSPGVHDFSDATLKAACETLRAGHLVAFPTETVYGLGADATNDHAVAKIFEAKGRPSFNPLITHVPSLEQAQRYGLFSKEALRVAKAFWPGPLTLVVKRLPDCPLSYLVSAGLETIALRVPAHKKAQSLLQASALPLAAPSANISGHISPTTADHVFSDLPQISILDGGPCTGGLESTVLDVSKDSPQILRPGLISEDAIQEVLGETFLQQATLSPTTLTSPGQLSSHYAPRTPLRLNIETPTPQEVFIGFGPGGTPSTFNLSPEGSLIEAAANLFSHLRQADNQAQTIGAKGIAVALIPETGIGHAINDRLKRAAAQKNA